jgi:hypothetical protein
MSELKKEILKIKQQLKIERIKLIVEGVNFEKNKDKNRRAVVRRNRYQER